MTKEYPSERAAALIRQGIDILERAEEEPESGVELKRITFELGGVMREEAAAVATTFDAIYRETEAEAKLQGAGSEAARRLPLIQRLVTVASKTGSRSRRQKGSPKAKTPLASNPRLQLLFELTAVKILGAPPGKRSGHRDSGRGQRLRGRAPSHAHRRSPIRVGRQLRARQQRNECGPPHA